MIIHTVSNFFSKLEMINKTPLTKRCITWLSRGWSQIRSLLKAVHHQELSVKKFLGYFSYGFLVFYYLLFRHVFHWLPIILVILLSGLVIVYVLWNLTIMRRYYYLLNPERTDEAVKASRRAFKALSKEEKAEVRRQHLAETKKKFIDFFLLRGSIMEHNVFEFPAALLCLTALNQLIRIMDIFWANV